MTCAALCLIFDNADLWIGDGSRRSGHLVIEGDTITAVGAGPAPQIAGTRHVDMNGAALSPGMIDLMVLGGFGKSILRDDPADIMREYVKLGVTACQLCIGTLPYDSTVQVGINTRETMRTAADTASDAPPAAELLGLYCEGPFQHPERTGASLATNALAPSRETVQRLLDDIGDIVTMINVSPGTQGDAEAVATLRAAGKVVSMAHSNAPADRIEACLEAGTSVLGHIWDNNSGLIGDSGVQQPTLEHVAMIDERVRFIHLICDGAHVHPLLIKLLLKTRGAQSVCLVTDAVPRAGCEDGEYVWDDGRVFYKKGGVGRTDLHLLTGSALLLPDMLRNFIKFTGLPPHQAIQTVTSNPAASIGLQNRLGLLAPGRRADIVAWDAGLRVRRVWRDGREIEDVSPIGEITI